MMIVSLIGGLDMISCRGVLYLLAAVGFDSGCGGAGAPLLTCWRLRYAADTFPSGRDADVKSVDGEW